MKPIVFYGTINLESDILYVQSNKDYYSVDDTFTLKINDSSFGIKSIKEDKKWFKFDKSKRHDGEIYLSIENDKKEIFNKDNIEVILKEFNTESYPSVTSVGKNYEAGEILSIEGYGGSAKIEIVEVNDKGEVTLAKAHEESSFFVDGYRSFFPEGGSGEGLEIVCEMIENNKKTVLEKNVLNSFFSDGKILINFEYEIPEFVETGEIKLNRNTITLDKPCPKDLSRGAMCICQKIEYTEKLGIPLVEKGTINSYNLYNRGADIIERQFLELEKRIEKLESRL